MSDIQLTLVKIKILKKLIMASYIHSVSYFPKSKRHDLHNNLSKYVDMQYVLDHPKEHWCYDYLSSNPNIKMSDVLANPHLKWCWYGLSRNPSIDINDVLNNLYMPWDWNELSENPGITLKNMLDHPELKWNYRYASRNPSIGIQDVLKHSDIKWDYELLSMNPNVSIHDVIKYSEIPWSLEGLVCNKNISSEDVKSVSNTEWHRKTETDDIIQDYGSLAKYFRCRSYPIITSDELADINIDEEDYDFMLFASGSPKITLYDVLSHPEYEWDHRYINLYNKKTLFYMSELKRYRKILMTLIKLRLQRTMWMPGNHFSQKMIRDIQTLTATDS